MRPDLRFLFSHPAHFVACGLGSGLSRFAPGTAGTLFSWAVYSLIRPNFDEIGFLVFLLVCFVGGVLACHRTGRDLGVVDHGSIVWDEIVPFWLVLFFCPVGQFWWQTALWQTAAFLLFRIYDIFKPYPANYFDEQVKNGFGVMMDDVFAGLYTILSLAVLHFVLGRLL
ncbi:MULTISPECIES: phosphatidylglycerophosphatase A [Azospira]|uniref:phosphatidylglycerophosphatase A family protein n=1 Tax=Azospira TaxID=146937 RepID=UPI000DB899A8|nr:phosphatidylglycerophosphatase A [Azospira oryzae]MDK9691340.1 phosphatidylglycerophosphatase A [Azospira sp.]PZR24990.1 MAG: phosphatidylglycerophosphatase A [Azospira oryzae]TLS19130.1 MAG: phosphatidylglycerophosphatase A [Betaproteobacteria bacterium]